MAFSKAVLLVAFAVLLISAEVSAYRYLAETTTTPTTYGRGLYPGVAIGRNKGGKPGGGVECSENKNKPCSKYYGGKGGKGGRGGHGPETKN